MSNISDNKENLKLKYDLSSFKLDTKTNDVNLVIGEVINSESQLLIKDCNSNLMLNTPISVSQKEDKKVILSQIIPNSKLNIVENKSKENTANKEKEVIFFCAFNQTYTKVRNYTEDSIKAYLEEYEKDNYFIIQIDNDEFLQSELAKRHFKQDFENYITQMNSLKVDYCFSPVDEYLYFNLSVVTNIDKDDIVKKIIQIIVHQKGIFINNKDGYQEILTIFTQNFSFRELQNKEFFKLVSKVKGKEESAVNDIKLKSFIENKFNVNAHNKKHKKKRRNSHELKKIPNLGGINIQPNKKELTDRQIQKRDSCTNLGLDKNPQFRFNQFLEKINEEKNSNQNSKESTFQIKKQTNLL